MVTHSEMWYHYVPESGNWHGGTFTRWITGSVAGFGYFQSLALFGSAILKLFLSKLNDRLGGPFDSLW
jgi:hypothetical protein